MADGALSRYAEDLVGLASSGFLVAVGDDDKARDAVAKAANASEETTEIVGHIPATTLASWGMTDGEVRLVLPGEPKQLTRPTSAGSVLRRELRP